MSKGGNDDKKKAATTTTPAATTPTTPYANAPVTQTIQPFMPGFQNMLAEQLSGGYGGGGMDFAAMLSSMYSPMSLVNYKEPISQTAKSYDKKKFAPISTGNPTLDSLLMGGSGGSSKDSESKTIRFTLPSAR